MLSSFRLAVGRTGQRGPFILSPGTHTAPHPSLCLSQASCPPSWPGGGEGPWRLQLRPHRPSPLPQPGTEQGRGRGSPPLQAPEGGDLAFPLALSGLERREAGGRDSGGLAPPCLGKAVPSWATSPTRAASWVLLHFLPWTVPRTGPMVQGTWRGPREGWARWDGLGEGCRSWLPARAQGDKAQAWQAFSSSDG